MISSSVTISSTTAGSSDFVPIGGGKKISIADLTAAAKKDYSASIFDKIKAFFCGDHEIKAKQLLHDFVWAGDLGTKLECFSELKSIAGDGVKDRFRFELSDGDFSLKLRIEDIDQGAAVVCDMKSAPGDFDALKKAYLEFTEGNAQDLEALKGYKLEITAADFTGGKVGGFMLFSDIINALLGGQTSKDGIFGGREVRS
ncbi:hypothetical protein D3C77_493150 [compost metagenome]